MNYLFPLFRVEREILPSNHPTHAGSMDISFAPVTFRNDKGQPEQYQYVAATPTAAWRMVQADFKTTQHLALGKGKPLPSSHDQAKPPF